MGYTHYWKFDRSKVAPETLVNGFYRASQNVKACRKHLPKWIQIRGGLGHGAAKINDRELWFNGDKATGADHETFRILRDGYPNHPGYEPDFCKTARKPYDILVVCSLLALEREFPDAFEWDSDGDDIELSAARAHFEKVIEHQFRHALVT